MIRPKIQRVMWHVAWAKQILLLLGYIFICMYIAGNAWGNNTSDGNLLTNNGEGCAANCTLKKILEVMRR